MFALTLLGWLPALLALVGCVYQWLAAAAILRCFGRPLPMSGEAPPLTLLKPLHGAEPRLAENLASFFAQDYAGPVQVVFGVNRPGDPALAVLPGLRAAFPHADIAVSHSAPAWGNAKMANLAAMLPLATHDVLVMADSDIAVGPDYLRTITAALAQPGVGAVSVGYIGRGDAGLWSQLGAAMLSFQAMPNLVLAAYHQLAQPCMGSTIALTRATLKAMGGFEGLADTLADDYAIGQSVRRLGLGVDIPPLLITHAGSEASLGELWRHFLRWAVTLRRISPAGHYGAVITMPLPLAMIAALVHPLAGLALCAAALVSRLGAALAMRWAARGAGPPLWLTPLADSLSFGVYLASLVARRVDWRGTALAIGGSGEIKPAKTL